MANQNIPVGKQCTVTVHASDAASADITSLCQVTALSSDPTTVQVSGGPSVNSFFVAAIKTGTATVTYKAVNSGGEFSQVDTINPPDPPTSVSVSYSAPV